MPDFYSQMLDWRRTEIASHGLGKLPRDFYASVSAYLAEVRRSYEADLRANPSSRAGELTRQTYRRAMQLARDIAETRLDKVLRAAFQAGVGGARDLPNALPEERTLFDRLLETLLEFRRSATPYLEAPAEVREGAPVPVAPSGAGAVRPAPPERAVNPPRVPTPQEYVRIVRDARAVQIGTESIDLRREDILSLPPEAARILVAGKMAEPIRTRADPPVT
ncbi:MAG: hypothetical protein QXG65_03625 [Thermoplasmata archaeon]